MRISSPKPEAQDRLAWAALYWAGQIGPAGFTRLLARFGSATAVIAASAEALALPGLSLTPAQVAAITSEAGRRLDQVEREIASLADDGIAVVCSFEQGYPHALRDAQNPPPVVCISGELSDEDMQGLAIVGTREPTADGRRVAREVARTCAERGITVVSGLARGIDTVAHRAALDAGGRTVAVLGSGIRHIHPRSNIRLATRLIEHGALISEVAPDANPTAARLMARNRLTSALARGVLAVESTLTGGTLQTAADAWKQGRVVFACDWPTQVPQAEGTRSLIARGAEPILGAGAMDTIEHLLRIHEAPPPEQPPLL